jgi:heterodisulfide reductase subunit A-like polyferredoxin
MNAALTLADQGFRVYLAERSGELGGVAANMSDIFFSECATNIDPNSGANLTNTSDPAAAY